MQPTERQGTRPKHPLKPTNRRPPRTQRQKWFLLMSGCIVTAILVLSWMLFWINRPVEVTINGKGTHVRIGSTATELFEGKHIEVTPGNVVSVNGRVLREGAGHAFSVEVNGAELSAEDGEQYSIQGGESIEFGDGEDVTEDYDVTTEDIAPDLAFDGTGTTVEYVKQWGYAGTLEHRTGKESGETALVTTKEAVPCIVKRTDLYLDDDHPYVAITFDDGPLSPYTEQYLDILEEHGVKATFYNLGENAGENPELARRVAEAGHQVANHTMAHNQLTTLEGDEVRAEIERSATVLEEACGVVPTHIRPPYGDFSEQGWLSTGGCITAVVRWSGDSQDWQLPGSEAIVENALINVHPGTIILMHDGGGDRSQDVEALPMLIDRLKDEGYELVTVSDLMRAVGDIPEEVCSGTGTMPEGAVWPDQIATEGYLESYYEQLEQVEQAEQVEE